MDFIKNIYQNIKSFFIGIKNIFQYIPVIYTDRDWDFFYLKELLRFKLKRMKKLFSDNGHLESNDKSVKTIDFCIRILDRMQDEYESYNHPEYKKWLESVKINIVDSEYEDYKSMLFSEELDKEKRDFYHKWYEHNYSRDKKLLFNVICKYIDSWWD